LDALSLSGEFEAGLAANVQRIWPKIRLAIFVFRKVLKILQHMMPAPIALEVLLDKINLLYQQAAHSPGGLKGLELDLLKKYTRDWYDALLELDRGSSSEASKASPAAPPALAAPSPVPAVSPLPKVPEPLIDGQDSFLYPSRAVVSDGLRKEDAPEIRAGWAYAPHPPRAEPDTPASPAAAVVEPAPVQSPPRAVGVPVSPPDPPTPAPPVTAPITLAPDPPTPAPPVTAPITLAPAPPTPAPPVTASPIPVAAPATNPNPTPDEPALNDRFARSERELGQTLAVRPAEDLRKLIDVNERFLFTRELFAGNSETYGQAIRQLNELSSLEDALRYLDRELTPAHAWNPESKVVLHLRDILEQRYR